MEMRDTAANYYMDLTTLNYIRKQGEGKKLKYLLASIVVEAVWVMPMGDGTFLKFLHIFINNVITNAIL